LSSKIHLGQKAAAELVGTFLFVFVGAGSVVTAQFVFDGTADAPTLLIVALANGLGLAVAISATMGTSGGHINPAVTLGLLVARRISLRDSIVYIISQIIGATIASLLLVGTLPSNAGKTASWGAPLLGSGIGVGTGIALELVMTFFLVFTVFGTIVDPNSPKIGGFGVGIIVAMDVLTGGPFTGAAMNPARAIGPEIAQLAFANWYVWWVGPIIGGVLAAVVYEYVILRGRKS
jgi:MIP family channel proteins